MLLGHWLEMRSIAQARGALAALAELLPDTRRAGRPATDRDDPARRARVGDVVLVRPGGRVPADGDGGRRERRRRRIDDHRRVARGDEAAGRQGRRRHGRRGRHRCGSASTRSAMRRRCRGSCAWSPRRRRLRRAPRRSPIAPPRSCSTSRSAAGRVTFVAWWLSATRRARSCARRRSSSSPARTPSASPSRW